MRKRICKAPGCCRLVDMDKGEVYCIEHKALGRAELERRRLNHAPYENARHNAWPEMYNSPKWKAIRQAKLKEQPFCEICGLEATEVHHRTPHNGNWALFLDWDNLMSICHECHLKETQKESRERQKQRRLEKERGHIWY